MNSKIRHMNAATIIGFMALAFVLLVLRRPDIITNAQPWAEDGRVWMAGIYNDGFWASLFLPQNGYYQTISRITYGFSLLFGIENASLLANIIAILIRCMFVGFIISHRMNFIDLKYRFIACFYFIIMPNVDEAFVNITNAHWYLSIYLIAVLIAPPPSSIKESIHDYIILIISGLSGPFVVFIAPCLIIKRIAERGGFVNAIKGINKFDLTMAVCCIIQITAILTSPENSRSTAPLGDSFSNLVKIISYRIVAGTFLNNSIVANIPKHELLRSLLFIVLVLPILYFTFKGSWRFRTAALFPILMFGFALAKPMMSTTDPQWPVFLGPDNGKRYFIVTNFAFFCLVLYMADKVKILKNQLLFFIIAFTIICTTTDFRMKPFPDVGYNEDLKKFATLPHGEKMIIRINPPGWTMELLKK
ncbi:hypothetical protein DEU53_102376 [Pantoea sp. AG1095]|uniref:glucosyl transferase n=1 Tax=Pantoea sp. AG1095 TaxID=2184004 RepID=UPI000D8ADEC2|nr:glucosyl transferase [Pantoea sp. AG1095]PYG50412.1 hypothetical protein DEU53_102376 [Pantoea sp. AG1095]